MTIVQSIFLGILQGLTEFLPVSSSGHLVMVQYFMPNFDQPGVLFDVVLHAGTLIAVFIYFRKTLFKLSKKYLYLLFLGTIPAILFGLTFKTTIEGFFINIELVGFALLITALLNLMTDYLKSKKQRISPKKAIIIGIAQALAIVPGISRSGSTIFIASKLGVDKEKAAEFSFILSIPAIVGANILQFYSYGPKIGGDIWTYLTGFMAALIAGYFAIGVAIKLLLNKRFRIFAYWAFVAGTVILIVT